MSQEKNDYISIQETVTFSDVQEVLTFQGRVEEASARHSATYFATCGCEIQVTTQVPIQLPISTITPVLRRRMTFALQL